MQRPMGSTDALLDRPTVTDWLRTMLQREFDQTLSAQGFTRSAKATAYVRGVPSGTQRLDFTLLMRPNWAKDAVVLSLHTSLLMPEVAARAGELLDQPRDSPRSTRNLVERELLETLVRRPPPMTFRSPMELDRYPGWIDRYLRERILPYFEARRTVREFADLRRRYFVEHAGSSGPWTEGPVVSAAAMLLLGDRDTAIEILETAYPLHSSQRTRYEKVINAVRSHSGRLS